MSWQDLANGTFEILAGVAVLNHCRVLYKDKLVRGASALSTAFFFAWGVWNLYYYPHLDQWFSFVGGLLIVTANCLWLGLMVYYKRHPGGRRDKFAGEHGGRSYPWKPGDAVLRVPDDFPTGGKAGPP